MSPALDIIMEAVGNRGFEYRDGRLRVWITDPSELDEIKRELKRHDVNVAVEGVIEAPPLPEVEVYLPCGRW